MSWQIITNNKVRDIVQGYELTEKEWEDFDYMGEYGSDDCVSAQFIRYKGELYYLNDFVRICNPAEGSYPSFSHFDSQLYDAGWNGILTDSYFSGIVIKWADDYYESVIVGRVFS